MMTETYTSGLDETEPLVMMLCTYSCMYLNIDFKIHDLFIELLNNKKLMSLFKDALQLESDFEVIKVMIDYNPDLNKNKIVLSYINGLNKRNENTRHKLKR